jgi:hypothetical protein
MGEAAEVLAERGQRRNALEAVALERGEIDAVARRLAHRLQLSGVAVASIHGPLQVGDLQRQQHAPGIGDALALGLEERLQVLLEHAKLGEHGGQLLGPGDALEAALDVRLQGLDALAEARRLALERSNVSIDAGRAGLGRLAGPICQLLDVGELGRQPLRQRHAARLSLAEAPPGPLRAWRCAP